MIEITLISPVLGDGSTKNPFRPKFSDDFPAYSYEDITGQETKDMPGDLSLVVIKCQCEDSNAIESNNDYVILDIVEILEMEEYD